MIPLRRRGYGGGDRLGPCTTFESVELLSRGAPGEDERRKALLKRFLRDDDAQGMVEYGLILGLISIVAIAALTAAGGQVNRLLGEVSGALSSVSS